MEDYIEININDELYPGKLKDIKNAPKKLYMRGNLGLLREQFDSNSRFKRIYFLWIL